MTRSGTEYDKCPACPSESEHRGTGRTHGIAKEVFANHPVERVVLTGKEPYHGNDSFDESSWWWVHESDYDGRRDNVPAFEQAQHTLPRDLWWRMATGEPGRGRANIYPSREAALDALSAACIAYGIATRST